MKTKNKKIFFSLLTVIAMFFNIFLMQVHADQGIDYEYKIEGDGIILKIDKELTGNIVGDIMIVSENTNPSDLSCAFSIENGKVVFKITCDDGIEALKEFLKDSFAIIAGGEPIEFDGIDFDDSKDDDSKDDDSSSKGDDSDNSDNSSDNSDSTGKNESGEENNTKEENSTKTSTGSSGSITRYVPIITNTTTDPYVYGNTTYIPLNTTSTPKTTPEIKDAIIKARPTVLKPGEPFNIMQNVTAIDDGGRGAIITYKVTTEGIINTKLLGSYSVTYSVVGANGNKVSKSVTLYVK